MVMYTVAKMPRVIYGHVPCC